MRDPNGTSIQDAIARGDLAALKAFAAEAERILRVHGDVRTSLEILKVEIAKLEPATAGVGPEPPYGPPIHQAIARGDAAAMHALLERAEALLARQGDLVTAVALLRTEIAKRHK